MRRIERGRSPLPPWRLGPLAGLLAATLLCAQPSVSQPLVVESDLEAVRLVGTQPWIAFCLTVDCQGSDYKGFLWAPASNIGLGTSHLNPLGELRFYTHGQQRAVIRPDGKTGINVNSPLSRLHVEDSGTAIYGRSVFSYGLYGYSEGELAILGYSNHSGGLGILGRGAYIGVEGVTKVDSVDSGRQGIRGDNHGSATGWAGYFYGNLGASGTLTKGAGAFRIDHPLEPETKYLYHSFVESPDMKNIYDGVVETDESGEARVELPEWFEALNRDFRYQLTVLGRFARAIVAEEIKDNRFLIQTDEPGVKVSWQVTGIRQDAYAEAHRIPVEEDKPREAVGRYLHPDLFDAPMELAIDWRPELQ